MSRSYKKYPAYIPKGRFRSHKWWKRKANSKLRSKVKRLLRKDNDKEILPLLKEISNIYVSPKDGGYYFGNDIYEKLGKKNLYHWGVWLYTSLSEEYKERILWYKEMMRK